MSIIVDVDLRQLLSDARDQGRRPTCLAFAVSAAHEAHRGLPEYLSPEFLFFNAVQRSHRDPHRGISAAAVATSLHMDGQPLEAAWPYLVQVPALINWHPPAITHLCYKAGTAFSLRTLDEVRTLLDARRPVILVAKVTTAMYGPKPGGVIRAIPHDVITAQSHALLAVGYGHSSDGSYVLVRNSWGVRWGDQGHGWVHESYLKNLLLTTAVVS